MRRLAPGSPKKEGYFARKKRLAAERKAAQLAQKEEDAARPGIVIADYLEPKYSNALRVATGTAVRVLDTSNAHWWKVAISLQQPLHHHQRKDRVEGAPDSVLAATQQIGFVPAALIRLLPEPSELDTAGDADGARAVLRVRVQLIGHL